MGIPPHLEGTAVSRGFSLLEVLVALLVIMLLFTAGARISILSTRSGSYARDHTCAAVLGHTGLVRLAGLDYGSPELRAGWHRDPANPIEYGGRSGYYRFWQIDESSMGKQVVLFVTWNEGARKASDFGSQVSLKESGCPQVWFSEIIPAP
ncbi:MAG: prepilin-type N-terminal cleavage/methylation domain-containing protein [Deltaproteobacteria bacterium]|nr:prepilin-type N-terminal cleavage/methylation domain-containing protein [Deltaproteobacteria bacterium]